MIRSALVDAGNYLSKLESEQRKPEAERGPASRDLKLEALGRVLRREIPWRQHCHRADDIATAMRIAEEFRGRAGCLRALLTSGELSAPVPCGGRGRATDEGEGIRDAAV